MKNNKQFSTLASVCLTLIVASMLLQSCSPTELAANVAAGGSFFTNNEGTFVGYGALPDGREMIGVFRMIGQEVNYSVSQTTASNTVRMTEALAQNGFKYIPFTAMPQLVQLRVLSMVEEFVSVGSMSVPVPAFLPVFLTAPIITLPDAQGCTFSNGSWNCSAQG